MAYSSRARVARLAATRKTSWRTAVGSSIARTPAATAARTRGYATRSAAVNAESVKEVMSSA
jgi:hypothetical protein